MNSLASRSEIESVSAVIMQLLSILLQRYSLNNGLVLFDHASLSDWRFLCDSNFHRPCPYRGLHARLNTATYRILRHFESLALPR